MEIVFDGNRLGNKSKEEDKRSYHREEQQRVARDLLEQGEEEKDKRIYVASLDITPQMVKKVAEKLKVMGVEYIVAPYKADAQLAYLDRIDYIDYVMMEDSDLLAYGCRRVLFKFNKRKKGRDLIHRDEFLGDFQSYSQFLEFCIFKRL